MKVHELIEKLEKMPKDADVLFGHHDFGEGWEYNPVDYVEADSDGDVIVSNRRLPEKHRT